LKRLICFGDSWTAGHGVETDVYWKEGEPSDFIVKLRQMNSWPRWLSDKLDCVFVNFGVCAWSNKQIAEQVETIVNQKYITKDDIVITMFSYPHRYRETNILDSPEKIFEKLEKLLTPYQHFYFNSFYPTFKDEGYYTKNLPDYFIKPDECVSDILKKYEIEYNISVWEYESRSVWNNELNFWTGDYHPNLLGYKLIADHIYQEINNKIT
jgi:lysophospholipase L1-like esterase